MQLLCSSHFLSLVCVCVCVRACACVCVFRWLSRVWLFAILCTVAQQAPPSMGCSRQEYWSGLPFPPPGDLPHPRVEGGSLASQTASLPPAPFIKDGSLLFGTSCDIHRCPRGWMAGDDDVFVVSSCLKSWPKQYGKVLVLRDKPKYPGGFPEWPAKMFPQSIHAFGVRSSMSHTQQHLRVCSPSLLSVFIWRHLQWSFRVSLPLILTEQPVGPDKKQNGGGVEIPDSQTRLPRRNLAWTTLDPNCTNSNFRFIFLFTAPFCFRGKKKKKNFHESQTRNLWKNSSMPLQSRKEWHQSYFPSTVFQKAILDRRLVSVTYFLAFFLNPKFIGSSISFRIWKIAAVIFSFSTSFLLWNCIKNKYGLWTWTSRRF